MDWNIEQRVVGPLRCTTVELPDDVPPQLAVVLCHGFGAPGTDLVGLGPELLDRLGDSGAGVKFYFPAAPLSLSAAGMPGGRAWWMLDLDELARAVEGTARRDPRERIPEGMLEAADLLGRTLEAIHEETGLELERTVLGGFSQGAMIATELALTLPDAPAAVLIFSGTLLCRDRWAGLVGRRGPLRVLQSHGTGDPLLSCEMAEELNRLLATTGGDVEFLKFPGQHTIPESAIEASTRLLRQVRENL